MGVGMKTSSAFLGFFSPSASSTARIAAAACARA
jgi:hypothetical protein